MPRPIICFDYIEDNTIQLKNDEDNAIKEHTVSRLPNQSAYDKYSIECTPKEGKWYGMSETKAMRKFCRDLRERSPNDPPHIASPIISSTTSECSSISKNNYCKRHTAITRSLLTEVRNSKKFSLPSSIISRPSSKTLMEHQIAADGIRASCDSNYFPLDMSKGRKLYQPINFQSAIPNKVSSLFLSNGMNNLPDFKHFTNYNQPTKPNDLETTYQHSKKLSHIERVSSSQCNVPENNYHSKMCHVMSSENSNGNLAYSNKRKPKHKVTLPKIEHYEHSTTLLQEQDKVSQSDSKTSRPSKRKTKSKARSKKSKKQHASDVFTKRFDPVTCTLT